MAVVALAAQPPPAQPPPPPQQPPVFRAGTNQVRVDVTVLDHKGEPVTDLTKDDFDVREDGIPQAIDSGRPFAPQSKSSTRHTPPSRLRRTWWPPGTVTVADSPVTCT